MNSHNGTTQEPPSLYQDMLCNEEAEQSLLACILVDGRQYDHAAMHIQSLDAFGYLRHQYVWDAMTYLKSQNKPIDMITLADRLEAVGVLDDIGGRAYIVKLSTYMGTAMYTPVYAEMVAAYYTRRKIVLASKEIEKLAYNTELDIHAIKGNAEDMLLKASGHSPTQFGGWSHEVMDDLYDQFEQMLLTDKTVPGIPTGITDLDRVMLGFEPEQLSIWAGRPGMGKSSTFISLVYNRCKAGDMVLMFSSEMSKQKVMQRLWSMESGVSVKKIKLPRKMTPDERKRVTDAVATVSEFKFFVDDTPNPTPRHIRSMTKIYIDRFGIQNIFVDGIYTMRPNVPNKSKVIEVGSISEDLREIARVFGIHVAATHQLNRAVETRQDKRPVLSDLRDSGQLEQDADKIIFLYRDEVYNEATEHPNQIDFIVAKHRDGETGIASAYFEKTLMQVKNGSFHRVDLSDLE